MNCNDYLLLLSAHIDGMNTQQEETKLQAHLKSCEDCRVLLNEMTKNDSILKSDQIEVPSGLTEKIMTEVRRTKKNKRPFYISLAASGLAAAAVLAVAFSGKVTPPARESQSAQTAAVDAQEPQLKQPLRRIDTAPVQEKPEFVTEGTKGTYEYSGVLPFAAALPDEMDVATVVDDVSVLVIRADPSEIDFSGRTPDLKELTEYLGDSAYRRTGDEIAFYTVSWQTMLQLAADYDGIFEMEKYYLEDVQYLRALVVFTE